MFYAMSLLFILENQTEQMEYKRELNEKSMKNLRPPNRVNWWEICYGQKKALLVTPS